MEVKFIQKTEDFLVFFEILYKILDDNGYDYDYEKDYNMDVTYNDLNENILYIISDTIVSKKLYYELRKNKINSLFNE